MEKEKVLKEIQSNIAKGNTKLASEQIFDMADHFSDDPFTLLTCASLLKVIEDEKGAERIASSISGKVKGSNGLEVAKGLRGIGFPAEAEKALSSTPESNDIHREKMYALFDMRRFSESLGIYERLADPTLEDDILRIGSLSAVKEHTRAVESAEVLLVESPDSLRVQKCYCAALTAAGRIKEAEKFVKDNLKKNKSSSDAEALAAYQLWIEGKSTSAGAYASRAIKRDPGNTIAMEILAYSLIEKGKLNEAKIVAGAINEKEPGNPAVVRILDMCRIAK
jgi:tetratricopeptide (TPR) repeat protein